MSVHPNGSGAAWEEDVDVDQPHGLDYQYINHVAKAVRLRMEKGHKAFADDTAGGEHIPGGAGVLGMDDGTAGIIADGTYKGKGLVWDMTGRLWCSTAVAENTTSGDWTLVKMHPDKQWGGGDITWTGVHQFDASACFTSGDVNGSFCVQGSLNCGSDVNITEHLSCGSAVNVDASMDISQTLYCCSDVQVAGDVSITTDLIVDGTAVFTSNVDVSGNADVSGVLSVTDISAHGALYVDATVDISGTTHISGDLSVAGKAEFSSSIFDGSVDISQTLYCYSSAEIVKDLSVGGHLLVDGIAIFSTDVDVSGTLDVSGTFTYQTYVTDTSDGHTYLPNAVVLQFGEFTGVSADTTGDVTYNFTFANAVLNVQLTYKMNAKSVVDQPVYLMATDITGFGYCNGHSQAGSLFWTAIGY
jgi:predicted acyltransferase (DUF342 family)